MRRHIATLGLALIVSTAGAQSDTSAQWPVGSRVRVRTADHSTIVGQLTEVRGSTLVIRREGGLFQPWKRLQADSVLRVDVSRGRYVSPRRIITGALGVSATFVMAVAVMDRFSVEYATGGSGGVDKKFYARAAAWGAGIGGVLGALHLADRWEEVPAPMRVNFIPEAGRTSIVVSLRFR